MRPRLGHALLVGLVLSLPCAARAQALDDVLVKAGDAVQRLEKDLPVILADEQLSQTADTNRNAGVSSVGGTGALYEGDTIRKKSTLAAEVLFVRRAPGAPTWSAIRRAIGPSESAASRDATAFGAVARDPVERERRWQALVAESRALHIGAVERDAEAPFTALAVLRADRRAHLSFRKDGNETIRGVQTWKVAFSETGPPYLVATKGHGALASRGTLWIDPLTGTVWRTRLDAGSGNSPEQHRIEVEFGHDTGLAAVVPVELKARYDGPGGRVDVKASYSNYRRPNAP